MSRPGTPQAAAFQSQQPPPTNPNTSRLMQVKVLYTFDDAKTNCLARCPHPVPVRTAMLDAVTEVGIIELRTCIQAIVTASPELVAKLGQDFTIYAYDYSEYETPLVGQGMLSWVLAAASATPTAPALESTTPVTGRVTRGGLNLFQSSSASETLEVKLKLVPVPTSLQSDYLDSMQKYRNASNFANQGGDATAWNDFLRTNPNFASSAPNFNQQQQAPQQPAALYQPTRPQSQNQCDSVHPAQQYACPPHLSQSVNTPSSRTGSRPSTPKGRRTGRQSRQPSRASSTRDRSTVRQSSSATSELETLRSEKQKDFPSEQPRKRARVEQTSWRGPSALASSNDSLRVAASTAASIRSHALPPANPATAQIRAGDPPVRPPTPRPSAPRQLKRTNTSLAHDAMMHRPSRSSALAGGSVTDNEESIATSPESHGDSAGSTPIDIPSSPPLMAEMSMIPSSPMLPRSSCFVDSGFGSSALDELFDEKVENAEFDTNTDAIQAAEPSNDRPTYTQPALTSELSITEETPGDPNLLPQRVMLTKRPPQPGTSKSHTRKRRAGSTAVSSPSLPPQNHSDLYSLSTAPLTSVQPPRVSHDQDYAPAKSMHELQGVSQVPGLQPLAPQPPEIRHDSTTSIPTSLPEGTSHPEGSMTAAVFTDAMAQGGSGVQRRRAIQSRLESDISKGKLPPYCKNCGEIETPTWRKCFVRDVQGPPPDFNPDVGLEGYIGREVMERNEKGEVLSHRVLRRSISKGEQDWEELKLCNSCGMWLFKLKSMRPPERWGRGPKPKTQSRKKPVRSKSAIGPGEPQSDAGSPTEYEGTTPFEPEMPQSNHEPFRAGGSGSNRDAQSGSAPRERSVGLQLERQQLRETGGVLDETSAMAALQRAIQSSPPRFPGSQEEPIDLEGEGNNPSIRRLLFPSPRKVGHMKTLDGSAGLQTGCVKVTVSETSGFPELTEPYDKENVGPLGYPRASTPPDRPTSDENIFKTPLRRTSRRTGLTPKGASPAGAALRRSPRFLRPEVSSPAKNPVTPFTATMNQIMSDPLQSPTNFSEQFDLFGDAAIGNASNTFDFTDFDKEGYPTDVPVPHSDADYFPVMNDFEFNGPWYGGPLLDGELDALLEEATDEACETYFAANRKDDEQSSGTPKDVNMDAITPCQPGDGQGGL